MHIEFLLEEESCAAALEILVPRIIGDSATFKCHPFQGKLDLLKKLPARLKGYGNLPADRGVVVVVDRDSDACKDLKARLEDMASKAGLLTRTVSSGKRRFRVLNRIICEELEAWFLGDVEALVKAYPGVPPTLASKRGFRDPDAVSGGTWEALERTLQSAGYYPTGMPKREVAQNVAAHMLPDRNRSASFRIFREGLRHMVQLHLATAE